MKYLIKFIISFGLILLLAIQSLAQTSIRSPLNLEDWNRLAERAESVIEAAAASNPALEILRSDLVEWSRKITLVQSSLKAEIDLLNNRLEALGEPLEGEDQRGDLAMLRSEIKSKLLEVERPYRIGENAVQHAQGLIDQIDAIISERNRTARATRGYTPLNPFNWFNSFAYIGDYLSSVGNKLIAVWERPAQREQFVQQLPIMLIWLVLGGLFMSVARPYVKNATNRFMPSSEADKLRGGGFRTLVADVILPAIGILMWVVSIYSIGLIDSFGERFVLSIAFAGTIIFAGDWLAKSLFAGDGTALILSCLGTSWSVSTRRTTKRLGWVLAIHTIILGIPLDTAEGQVQLYILAFPVLLATAFLLFRLCALISENLSAIASIEAQRPYSDVVLTGITWLARIAAVVGALLAMIGYGAAGDYLIFPILYSIALLGAFFAFEAIISGLILEMNRRGGFEASSVRTGLVRVIVGTCLVILTFPLLALAWGATITDILDAWQRAIDGVSIGSQKITVGDVFRFIVVFAVGCILTALIQSILQRSVLPNTRLNSGAQRALITGVGYVGVIIAGIVAVAMTNFDFTNIAIVAGALSVGIGFGLQTVVSNFVSGIILLVERPINVGDWIEVGGVSGTVRNVSVRSTQIETFNRALVVVPNTDLIGGQVTNWTLENRRGRVILPIGVAYGTDTQKVKNILLEIAGQHPAVMKDPAPSVIFMNFGADALEFELRVILYDVNDLLSARSDMNFKISKRFDKENISIPFAQRDIWIRNPEDLIHVNGEGKSNATKE